MKNTKIIFAVIILAYGLQAFPQINRANRQYDLFRYSKAIPLYKKAAQSKDDKVRKEATAKLADCYRFINDVNEARSWYLRATEFSDTDPLNYFYLGQALRSQEKYAEARQAFLKFSELAPENGFGKLYADYCLSINDWLSLSPSAEVKNVSSLNSKYSDFGPAFYKDGVVLTSDRQLSLLDSRPYYWTNFSYLDLYYSEPKFYQDYWSNMSEPASLSQKFNQSYHDGPAFFVDNSMIFLTRTTMEKVKRGEKNLRTHVLKIYYAKLIDGKPEYKEFSHNSDQFSNGHPTVLSDRKTMIFASDRPGGSGGTDLYKSVLDGSTWSEPENLGNEINSIGNELFPTIVNDTLLYFASDGLPGYGGLDLYVSTFSNNKWGAPVNLKAPINSSYDDFAIAMAADLASGFFSSDRPNGLGSDDIYAFRKASKPVKQGEETKPALAVSNLNISGKVIDKTTGIPIPGTKVFLLSTKTNKVKVLETGPDGVFTSPVEKGVLYIAKAEKPDFLSDCINFRISPDDTASLQKTPRDLMLDKLEVNKSFVIENIYYDLDKWYIREDAKPPLDNLVNVLKQYPITIELSSHTDSRASHEYNDELSQKRAESAVRYIMLQGIDPSRMIARGYGETRLVNKCADGVDCSEAEHQANRRTEFKILSYVKPATDKRFNPDVFTTGEEVDVYLFDPDFFDYCFGSNEEPGQIAKPVIKESVKPMSNAKPEESVSAEVNDSDCYGVQLLASITEIPLNSPELKGAEGVKSYFSGKWYKYIAGCTQTYEQAVALKKKMIEKGLTEAFVIKVENGKVVSAR
ncbi:MAG: OmpA family protein [Bacteroidales bacterium]|nr:OmpA family protein [Bacteroidales bacterium]